MKKLLLLSLVFLSQVGTVVYAADYNFKSTFNNPSTYNIAVEYHSSCNFKIISMTNDYYVDWYVNNSIYRKQDEKKEQKDRKGKKDREDDASE